MTTGTGACEDKLCMRVSAYDRVCVCVSARILVNEADGYTLYAAIILTGNTSDF
jgi:hypothetical protein